MQDYRKNAICRIIAILVKIALVDNLQNKNLTSSSVYKQVETVTKSLYQVQVINVSLWEMKKCDPLHINIDFELAVIKTIKAVFGDHVHMQGCFYH